MAIPPPSSYGSSTTAWPVISSNTTSSESEITSHSAARVSISSTPLPAESAKDLSIGKRAEGAAETILQLPPIAKKTSAVAPIRSLRSYLYPAEDGAGGAGETAALPPIVKIRSAIATLTSHHSSVNPTRYGAAGAGGIPPLPLIAKTRSAIATLPMILSSEISAEDGSGGAAGTSAMPDAATIAKTSGSEKEGIDFWTLGVLTLEEHIRNTKHVATTEVTSLVASMSLATRKAPADSLLDATEVTAGAGGPPAEVQEYLRSTEHVATTEATSLAATMPSATSAAPAAAPLYASEATAGAGGPPAVIDAKKDAEDALARLLERVKQRFPSSGIGPIFSCDSFYRAAFGVGFHDPIPKPHSMPPSYFPSTRPVAVEKTIPPFRERNEGESEEVYLTAKAAYDSVRSSKPLCTASDFGKGSLILNSRKNIPLYFHASQAQLRSCLKDILIYMAVGDEEEDLASSRAAAAAKEIFPDIEATITHLMPTIEGLLSKGLCFGFAMSFAAYLSQEKDLKKTEEEFTKAFIELRFDQLAPTIQMLHFIQPSIIQSALTKEDRMRYDRKTSTTKAKPSISRKLVFTEAPPYAKIRYSGSPASVLGLIKKHIEQTKKIRVDIAYTCDIFPESSKDLSFLEAQILNLMRRYRNHPAVFRFESHALCFFTTLDGLYLLDDGNMGCKIFSSEKEAVEAIARHVMSYGKDKVLDCHVFV